MENPCTTFIMKTVSLYIYIYIYIYIYMVLILKQQHKINSLTKPCLYVWPYVKKEEKDKMMNVLERCIHCF